MVKIVRIQAFVRGFVTRRRLRRGQINNKGDMEHLNDPSLEYRPEFVFENGAVYKGQWKETYRHGYGVQIWPDGAKYEGYWKNNKAHGLGKFWHADGDVFDG